MKHFLKYYFLFSFFICAILNAQDKAIDSLRLLLKQSKDDTTRVNLLNDLFDEFKDIQFDSAEKYAKASLELSRKINFKKGEARALYRSGYIYAGSENERALKFMRQGLILMEQLKMKKEISAVVSDIAYVYQQEGSIDTALKYFFIAQKMDEENDDKEGIAYSYNNIGTVYYYQGKVENALEYFQKALKIREELNQSSNIANTLNNIAGIYMAQQQYEKAFEYLNRAFKVIMTDSVGMEKGIAASILTNLGQVCERENRFEDGLVYLSKGIKFNEDVGDKAGLAHCYNAMGNIFHAQKKYKEALDALSKSLELAEKNSQQRIRAHVLVNVAEVYIDMGQYDAALAKAEEGMNYAKEIGFPENIESAAKALSIIYARKNNFQKAYEYHLLFMNMKDSVTNIQNARMLNDMQTKYETEKKDKEILMLNKDKQIQELDIAKKDADINKQRIIIWSAIGGILLLMVLAFFIYQGYQEKKKANEIITAQKSEVEKQKNIIEEKNKDITDSINYAQRIQQAILPKWEEVEKVFPDSFVLYKPRDIISGDFYWFLEKPNHVLLAACDCTGHGVPGSLMSMIGSSSLHQIVNEKAINDPSDVLKVLDKEITKALHQTGFEGETKDGMDIAFIEIDKHKRTLRYAGANRPLYIIRNKQLIELKPDKNSIGGYTADKKFNTRVESLFSGDCIYLFSDGYPDQFGGERQKKITTKMFKQHLLSVYQNPMKEQKQILSDIFEKWQGSLEQIDDVLVIGIRI